MHDFLLFAGAFLASAVEMVEALTQRLSDRLSLGLPGEFGESAGKFLGLLITNIERHGITTCRHQSTQYQSTLSQSKNIHLS